MVKTVISNEFKVYRYIANQRTRLEELLPDKNLTHYWANHSVNPLDPSIYTNSIEGFWSMTRKHLKRNIPIHT